MKRLGALQKGERGIIRSVGRNAQGHAQESICARLLAMGLIEGVLVEVRHEAPWGKDPIAVDVRGTLIGLRREEANFVEVEECT